MPDRLERTERATKARTRRLSTRAATADEREAFLRKNWAAARAMYQEAPDGHWALRYVITGPEPPDDLVERVRNGKLTLPSDRVAFSQRLIWEWMQAGQVRIEVPRRDDPG